MSTRPAAPRAAAASMPRRREPRRSGSRRAGPPQAGHVAETSASPGSIAPARRLHLAVVSDDVSSDQATWRPLEAVVAARDGVDDDRVAVDHLRHRALGEAKAGRFRKRGQGGEGSVEALVRVDASTKREYCLTTASARVRYPLGRRQGRGAGSRRPGDGLRALGLEQPPSVVAEHLRQPTDPRCDHGACQHPFERDPAEASSRDGTRTIVASWTGTGCPRASASRRARPTLRGRAGDLRVEIAERDPVADDPQPDVRDRRAAADRVVAMSMPFSGSIRAAQSRTRVEEERARLEGGGSRPFRIVSARPAIESSTARRSPSADSEHAMNRSETRAPAEQTNRGEEVDGGRDHGR